MQAAGREKDHAHTLVCGVRSHVYVCACACGIYIYTHTHKCVCVLCHAHVWLTHVVFGVLHVWVAVGGKIRTVVSSLGNVSWKLVLTSLANVGFVMFFQVIWF